MIRFQRKKYTKRALCRSQKNESSKKILSIMSKRIGWNYFKINQCYMRSVKYFNSTTSTNLIKSNKSPSKPNWKCKFNHRKIIITGDMNLCSLIWAEPKFPRKKLSEPILECLEQNGLLIQNIWMTYQAYMLKNWNIPESTLDHVYINIYSSHLIVFVV